jgi:hypothetical protein
MDTTGKRLDKKTQVEEVKKSEATREQPLIVASLIEFIIVVDSQEKKFIQNSITLNKKESAMIIYPIDDKKEELVRANQAIKANGHELLWGGSYWDKIEDKYESLGKTYRFNDREHEKNPDITYGMNLPYCEIEKAVDYMQHNKGGIITDLMFRTTPSGDIFPPGGLLVVMHALGHGVPVVVCTNAGEFPDHHHGKELSWIYDGYIKHAMNEGRLPFGWIENKDWVAAVKLLEQLHAQKNKN